MTKIKCQECTKQVEPTEKHTYEDCQRWKISVKLANLHKIQEALR